MHIIDVSSRSNVTDVRYGDPAVQPVQGPSYPVLRAQHVVLLDPQEGGDWGEGGVTPRVYVWTISKYKFGRFASCWRCILLRRRERVFFFFFDKIQV